MARWRAIFDTSFEKSFLKNQWWRGGEHIQTDSLDEYELKILTVMVLRQVYIFVTLRWLESQVNQPPKDPPHYVLISNKEIR